MVKYLTACKITTDIIDGYNIVGDFILQIVKNDYVPKEL